MHTSQLLLEEDKQYRGALLLAFVSKGRVGGKGERWRLFANKIIEASGQSKKANNQVGKVSMPGNGRADQQLLPVVIELSWHAARSNSSISCPGGLILISVVELRATINA